MRWQPFQLKQGSKPDVSQTGNPVRFEWPERFFLLRHAHLSMPNRDVRETFRFYL